MRSLAVRVFVRVLAWLPVAMLRPAAVLFGRALWLVESRMARVTRTNVALAFPRLGDTERVRLARVSLAHTCTLALEAGWVWGWPVERVLARVASVEGRELVERALVRGRGVILLAPHLGNWEVANLYVTRHFGVTALYRPSGDAQLDEVVRAFRERSGARMMPADAGGIRAVLKTLHSGECIAILPDQVPKQGVEVEFFGHPALTMTLVHRLVRRTGARVLCVVAQRLHGGEFGLRFLELPAEISDCDPRVSAQAMNDVIERCVLEAPEQYQWEYKRFRGLAQRVY